VKKVLFVTLAVMLALGVSLIGCGGETVPPQAPESILVGLVRDLNGPLAAFDCGYGGTSYRYFVDKVNKDGGILLSKYAEKVPIELKVRDFDPLNWATLATETRGLIDADKVNFVWGGPGTDCIYTQAPICNKAPILLVTLEGGASTMIWEKEKYLDVWPYVWVSLSFANWYQIPVLQDMLDSVVGTPKAWVTHIGEAGATHGQEYLQETKNQFGEANVIDAGAHPYFPTDIATQAAALVAKAKEALGDPQHPNYDVACFFTYPWWVFNIIGAILADGEFNPPAIIFGPGGNIGDIGAAFGPMSQGLLSFTVANEKTVPNVGTPTMSMADMYTALGKQVEADWANTNLPACDKPVYLTSGAQAVDYWGMPCYIAALEMWKQAVEEVGDVVPGVMGDIRDAMAGFSEDNPATTVLGDCWYRVYGGGDGGGVLDYLCHTGEIGQWQGMKYETVGYTGINSNLPNYDVTANFIYPMTDKWGWLAT
jgi:hypothetical protein